MLTGVERSNELVPNGHASVLTNAIPRKGFINAIHKTFY